MSKVIDIDRAVRLNRQNRDRLGWGAHIGAIARAIGYTGLISDERQFSKALATWQEGQGLEVDGALGPNTWGRLRSLLNPSASVPSSAPADIPAALGTLVATAPGRAPVAYAFTRDDLIWTAKLLVHESGGEDDAENAAVLWAMFNRYALFTRTVFPSFAGFVRAYSTTLQPVLLNSRAAQAHVGTAQFVPSGGVYPGTNIPRGQLRRHLDVQRAPWSSIKPSARRLALRALQGSLPNPGIGNASDFASTRIFFRRRHKREPSVEEWRRFTEAYATSKKRRWVGDVAEIDQMKNAFFVDLRVVGLAPGAVSVTPARGPLPDREVETWTTPAYRANPLPANDGEVEAPYSSEGTDFEAQARDHHGELSFEWELPYGGGGKPGFLAESEEENPSSAWQAMVRIAMAGGLRDENRLSNLVFFARHPERQGRKLSAAEPHFASLRSEWLQIRNTIVRPALGRPRTTPAAPAPSMGPLQPVAIPLLSGATSNRFGLPETIQALMWIEAEWTRRHPEVRFGVRDISRRGGGKLGSHKSHRVGLDADVNLVVNGKRIDVSGAGYERLRPFVQELVDVIHANPVLKVKTIGFLDPKIKGVALWERHTKHLHIRFCRPDRYASGLELHRVYDRDEAKPSYDCGSASEFEEGQTDLYYEYDSEDEASDETLWAGSRNAETEARDLVAMAADQLHLSGVETEQFFEPFRRLARPFAEGIKILRAIQNGQKDESALTNLVFFERHPSRIGRPLRKDEANFAELRREWLQIRDVVRPILWGHIRTEARRCALAEWQWWGHGTRVENEPGVQDRLRHYWSATPRMPAGEDVWRESWSAAFISRVLRDAGVGPSFHYHNAHRFYVHEAIRNVTNNPSSPIKAFPAAGPDRVKPRIGDLVCSWREGDPITYAELAGMAQPPNGQAMHCDLVTEVEPDRILVVGGNKSPAPGVACPANLPGCSANAAASGRCGCTVNRARHGLTDGFLNPLTGNDRGWIAVLRIGP